MLRKILKLLLVNIVLLSSLTTMKIDNKSKLIKTNNLIKISTNAKSERIGNLIINKINLDEPLYEINSKKNNVDSNVTILKESIFPPNKDSIIFLAAHSGTGKIAYFEELDQLEKNDIVTIVIKDKKYDYYVKDIWEEEKTGYINVNKEEFDQLILTTCSPNRKNYQLIVNCIKRS